MKKEKNEEEKEELLCLFDKFLFILLFESYFALSHNFFNILWISKKEIFSKRYLHQIKH